MKLATFATLAATSVLATAAAVWVAVEPAAGAGRATAPPAPPAPPGPGEPAVAPPAPPPAPPAPTVDRSRFAAGKTLLLEGRLGHAQLPADQASETFLFLDVSADAGRTAARVPPELAIVLDKSGSMKGRRMANAMAATRRALERLRDGDVVSFITYDTSAELVVPPTVIDAASRRRLLTTLTAPRPSKDTCISCGLDAGLRALGQRPGRVRRVLLLSDGLATAGMRDLPGFQRLAEDARRLGASITTVGVDVDYDERILAALARDSNGGHYFVERPDGLPAIFDEEMRTLGRTVASATELVVDLAPGVSAEHVYDRVTVSSGRQLVVPLGTVAAGERKTALIRLRVPAGAAGARPVADVRLRYDDLVDQRPGLSEGALVALATADASEPAPLDGVVSARLSASETAATLEHANELYRRGREGEATTLLRARAGAVRVQTAAARSAPMAGADPDDADAAAAAFAEQEKVLDRAARGFAPASPTAAPPPADSKPAKANMRNAQADALTIAR